MRARKRRSATDEITADLCAVERATALLEGEPEDTADVFASALTMARAIHVRDAALDAEGRKRLRAFVLLRATQGDLASAMAFAGWMLQ